MGVEVEWTASFEVGCESKTGSAVVIYERCGVQGKGIWERGMAGCICMGKKRIPRTEAGETGARWMRAEGKEEVRED